MYYGTKPWRPNRCSWKGAFLSSGVTHYFSGRPSLWLVWQALFLLTPFVLQPVNATLILFSLKTCFLFSITQKGNPNPLSQLAAKRPPASLPALTWGHLSMSHVFQSGRSLPGWRVKVIDQWLSQGCSARESMSSTAWLPGCRATGCQGALSAQAPPPAQMVPFNKLQPLQNMWHSLCVLSRNTMLNKLKNEDMAFSTKNFILGWDSFFLDEDH